jgi:hypothetical protein
MNEKQKEIIADLELDFNKLNGERFNSSNSLIDVNAIMDTLDAGDTILSEVRASNKAFKKLIAEQVKLDFAKIKDDISDLGLFIDHDECRIHIGSERNSRGDGSTYITGYPLTFNYDSNTDSVRNPSGYERKMHSPYINMDWSGILHNGWRCNQIEGHIKSKDFIDKITQLVVIVKRKKAKEKV